LARYRATVKHGGKMTDIDSKKTTNWSGGKGERTPLGPKMSHSWIGERAIGNAK